MRTRVDEKQARAYIKQEIERYISSPRQLEERIEDRLIECKAKELNPLDWVYLEVQEEVNFKRSIYFRWEKKYGSK